MKSGNPYAVKFATKCRRVVVKRKRKNCISGAVLRKRAIKKCKHKNLFVFYSCMFDTARGFRKTRREYNEAAKFFKLKVKSKCTSLGDPHMRSFGGFAFNAYKKANRRLLYKDKHTTISTDIRYGRWGRKGINSKVYITEGRKSFSVAIPKDKKTYDKPNDKGFNVKPSTGRGVQSFSFKLKRVDVRVLVYRRGYINVYVTSKTKIQSCKGDCCVIRRRLKLNPYRVRFRKRCKRRTHICKSAALLRREAIRKCRHKSKYVFFSCMYDTSLGFRKTKQEYDTAAKFLKQKIKNKCSSLGDPHMRSFGGLSFNVYKKASRRILFKDKHTTISTDIIYSRWGRRGINKKVYIKHGKKTFSVSIPKNKLKGFNKCTDNSFGVRPITRRATQTWLLRLNNINVRVIIYRRGYLNVYVTAKKVSRCAGDCCVVTRRGKIGNPYKVKFFRRCRRIRRKSGRRLRR